MPLNFSRGLQLGQAFKSGRTRNRLDALAQGEERQKALFEDVRNVKARLQGGDVQGSINVLNERLNLIRQVNGDPSDSMEILRMIETGNVQGALNQLDIVEGIGVGAGFLSDPLDRQIKQATIDRTKSGGVVSAKQREFESLTSGLTKEQKDEAVLIELGLSPRAVGSGAITIAGKGLTDAVAESQATIKQRTKFAEMTGSSRAQTIDKGIVSINKINKGINNIDRAVDALNKGAGVGAIQSFLPSIRAASVELDQIQKEMALDVIGAVTFGALSKGELDLAKEVALPKKLNKEELIQHLNDRRAAQEKLRDYFNKQIQFLDQGGTVAGFLRQQERDSQATAEPAQNIIRFDDQGNIIQ